MVNIYTDGSSSGGLGEGGYGWLLVIDDEVHYAGFGHADDTTNNLMELKAACEGLIYIIGHPVFLGETITVVTDSDYVISMALAKKVSYKNLEETQLLRDLTLMTGAHFQWVRGHSGNVYNEAADSLAKMGKRGFHKDPRQKQINKKKRKELRQNEDEDSGS